MPIFWNYTKRQKLKERRALALKNVSLPKPPRSEKMAKSGKFYTENRMNAHIDKFTVAKPVLVEDNQENVDIKNEPFEAKSEEDFSLYLEDDPEDLLEPEISNKPKKNLKSSNRFKRGHFVCPECNVSFTFAHNLKRHIKNKHQGLKYRCQECPKAYTTERCLKLHVGQSHL